MSYVVPFFKKYVPEFFKRFTWPHSSFIHEIILVDLFIQSAFIKTVIQATHISAHVCSIAVQHPDGRLLSDLTVFSSVELFLTLSFGLYCIMAVWGTSHQLLPGPLLGYETEVLCALFLCVLAPSIVVHHLQIVFTCVTARAATAPCALVCVRGNEGYS